MGFFSVQAEADLEGIADYELLADYPQLACEDILAAIAYGAEAVRERVIPAPTTP